MALGGSHCLAMFGTVVALGEGHPLAELDGFLVDAVLSAPPDTAEPIE